MNGRELNHELDDELLSAYLDGELSTEDRTAVEARLAADPAAQQLLHELRSVSQAAQALPLEKVGRDLSAEVVRRAQAAKPQSLKMEPARSTVSMPKLPVFGSKRAWIWASLALAAGLLIMVVQSGDERRDNLPAVAQRDDRTVVNQPVEKSGERSRREAASSAAPESKENWGITSNYKSMDKPAFTDGPGPQAVGQLQDQDTAKEAKPGASSLATGSPAPKNDQRDFTVSGGSKLAVTKTEPKSVDKLAKQQESTGRARGVGGELSGSASDGKSESAEQQQPLVVVHVVTKRAAFEKKSFDQLLVSNGIAVEPDRPKEETSANATRYARQAEDEIQLNRQPDRQAAGEELEVVLVEASAPAIAKCVESLNKDSENYSDIEVAKAAAPDVRLGTKLVPSKKIADDLSVYNRGAVPQQQKDSLRPSDLYGYQYFESFGEQAADRSSRDSDRAAVSDSQRQANSTLRTDLKPSSGTSADNLGRAWRVQTRHFQGGSEGRHSMRSGGFGGQATAEALKKPAAERKLKEMPKPGTGKLYALFVLSPQETAAAAPTAASSAPAAAAKAPAAASSPQPAKPAK